MSVFPLVGPGFDLWVFLYICIIGISLALFKNLLDVLLTSLADDAKRSLSVYKC